MKWGTVRTFIASSAGIGLAVKEELFLVLLRNYYTRRSRYNGSLKRKVIYAARVAAGFMT